MYDSGRESPHFTSHIILFLLIRQKPYIAAERMIYMIDRTVLTYDMMSDRKTAHTKRTDIIAANNTVFAASLLSIAFIFDKFEYISGLTVEFAAYRFKRREPHGFCLVVFENG